jgi:hypothetical protein
MGLPVGGVVELVGPDRAIGFGAGQRLGQPAGIPDIVVGVAIGTAGTSTSRAPARRSMSFFSWLWVSGITMTVRYPIAAPTSASPIPVLPAVPSTMVPPGRRSPRATASRMIDSAARSLTDWPGLRNSALPRISQPVSSDARRNRISGVLPTEAGRSGLIFMAASIAAPVPDPGGPAHLPDRGELRGGASAWPDAFARACRGH